MGSYIKAIGAGFIATVILSIIMVLKSMMGVMPQMNAIAMLTQMAHGMAGMPASPAVGWVLHFVIGSLIWGVLFALLYAKLPGASALPKALSFSVLAWLLMMVVVMPIAGQGLFGLGIGVMASVATLVLHLIWGLALGVSYRMLNGQSGTEHGYSSRA
ncbi:hypothetical protein MSNKSG1_15522 [Marinobacter santoriniensis NKSG1]|uniref:Transmembrane protein n=1 Tax=Marinobacter santoriniensis NKSG1 TaxID=1288826 RepID=M7DAN7_9GAMM|nr:DUF6789 family protein [Marinobacter santoriniensis]EMP54732.1 hypothetical protein MSNKSG1_15522 [Marinobacter santoriniensis NKSG1]